ncbi:hypothetical protein JCM10207_000238 [Rhodosporidiobolus poonsookiae]
MVAAPLTSPAPRRVSYILPPPVSPPPLLALPPVSVARRGHTSPIFSFTGSLAEHSRHKYSLEETAHPRHRLAVQALALDLSTSLSHDGEVDPTPGGILYTGGRDGLLCSWDLGLPTRSRKGAYGRRETDDDDDSSSSGDEAVTSGDDDDREGTEAVGALELDDLGTRTLARGGGGRRASTVSKRRSMSGSSTATTKQGLRPALSSATNGLPFQDRWEVDDEAVRRLSSPPKAKFHQCIQSHTDWVNDIVLCNYNRTLVSASSDSLVLAWNPHSSDHHDQVTPTPIGRHDDYVRCLATGRDTNWVASAGFDRKIKLWDVGEGRNSGTPVVELPSPPASVYSLGTTHSGSLIAAGTPERVVRVWDPRSRKQVSRLGGHTDNIRAVILSDDGKWLLSASSDSTVKLWSLSAQKALHTFAHHASSVWSLFSQHPSLEIFYSGDRAGNLCKVDLEGTGDPAEGECIVLARDGPDDGESKSGQEGITQLVAQDDSWIWTASGSSSVKRWKDVPSKARRAGAILRRAKENGELVLPEEKAVDSPVSSPPTDSSPNPASPSSVDRDRPVPFSVSFLENLTTPLGRTSSSPTPRSGAYAPHLASSGRPSSLRTPRLSVTSQHRVPLEQLAAVPSNPTTLLDIPYDSLVPLTNPEDAYLAPAFHRYRDPDAATIYSTVSGTSAPGPSAGPLHRPHLVAASSSSFRRPRSILDASHDATNIDQREYLDRESAAEATPLRSDPDDVIEGGYGLMRCELLNDRQHALTQDVDGEVALWDIIRGACLGVFSPSELQDGLAKRRPSDAAAASLVSGVGSFGSWGSDPDVDLLEYVRERIEGEVSIATWCKCDTRTGALAVHLEQARVFDAEAYIDECGLGPPEDYPADHRILLGKWVLRQLFDGFVEAEMALRVPEAGLPPSALFGTSNAPSQISLAGLSTPSSPRARGPRTPGMTIALATPAMKKAVLPDLPALSLSTSPRIGHTELAPIPQSPLGTTPFATQDGGKTPTMERPEGDYFSLRPTTTEAPTSASIASPSFASKDFGNASPAPTPGLTTPLPTPGGTGTLMGRLRLLGKGSKKSTAAEAPALTTPVVETVQEDGRTIEEQQQQFILDTVFSQPLAPCPLVDAPRIRYDPDMAVIISEELGDAWSVKYRGLVGTSYEDRAVLEQNAPLWLLDFLLGNRTFVKDPVKVSFVLQPWKVEDGHTLPELPNSNARLTANRSLRIRKVCSYVADKLDLRRPSRAPSIMDGASTHSAHSSPAVGHTLYGDFNPEKELEILVNGQVLPINVTLATVRHCMWKGGGDVVLQYRQVHDEEEE